VPGFEGGDVSMDRCMQLDMPLFCQLGLPSNVRFQTWETRLLRVTNSTNDDAGWVS